PPFPRFSLFPFFPFFFPHLLPFYPDTPLRPVLIYALSFAGKKSFPIFAFLLKIHLMENGSIHKCLRKNPVAACGAAVVFAHAAIPTSPFVMHYLPTKRL
ncbi:MAG: hypothetical protein ACLFPE_13955, partial [Bacteroidales bacterium]